MLHAPHSAHGIGLLPMWSAGIATDCMASAAAVLPVQSGWASSVRSPQPRCLLWYLPTRIWLHRSLDSTTGRDCDQDQVMGARAAHIASLVLPVRLQMPGGGEARDRRIYAISGHYPLTVCPFAKMRLHWRGDRGKWPNGPRCGRIAARFPGAILGRVV